MFKKWDGIAPKKVMPFRYFFYTVFPTGDGFKTKEYNNDAANDTKFADKQGQII